MVGIYRTERRDALLITRNQLPIRRSLDWEVRKAVKKGTASSDVILDPEQAPSPPLRVCTPMGRSWPAQDTPQFDCVECRRVGTKWDILGREIYGRQVRLDTADEGYYTEYGAQVCVYVFA